MQKEVKIIGTREGYYLACIDEERAKIECDEDCPACPHTCKVLLDKEQYLESGRRVLAAIKEPLFLHPEKFYPILAGIVIGIVVLMLIFLKFFLHFYRSSWPAFLSGLFGAVIFYLLVKLSFEKKGGKKNLRKGRILRAFPPDRR